MHIDTWKKLAHLDFWFSHLPLRKSLQLRKRVFLYYLPYYETKNDADFSTVIRMYYRRTGIRNISSFFHLRLRKCGNASKSFSAPMSLFFNGFTYNSEYICTMEANKTLLRKHLDFSFPLAAICRIVAPTTLFLDYSWALFTAICRIVAPTILSVLFDREVIAVFA